MTDWFDPTIWEQGAKATAALLDVLAKLRDALSRRRKATRSEDKRELDKEVDALQADFEKLVEAMTEHVTSHGEFVKAVVNLLGPMDAPDGKKNVDTWIELIKQFGLVNRATANLAKIVPDHERRLKALEHPPKDRRKRVPQKRRRK
jgi:ABC-type Zn uptake system ZnuABC Zn-binding protein ZnuA